MINIIQVKERRVVKSNPVDVAEEALIEASRIQREAVATTPVVEPYKIARPLSHDGIRHATKLQLKLVRKGHNND